MFIIGSDDEVAGTGFLVNVHEFGETFRYIVTAAHVVSVVVAPDEPWAEQRGTKIRIRQVPSGVRDEDVHQWIFHDSADIAITPYMPNKTDDIVPYGLTIAPLRGNEAFFPIQLGEVVYFVGQLYYVPRMIEKNIPMVRSGTVGVMYQGGIPVDWFGVGHEDSLTETFAHLIDCRSYFGFSGSPVFLQRQVENDRFIGSGIRYIIQLFGIISGHFPQPEHIRLQWQTGPEEYGSVNISAGVGIVTPIEMLVELLRSDEETQVRKEEAKERKKKKRPPAAVGDHVPTTGGLDRMSDLTRDLLAVPKDEADEVHRRHQE